MVLTFSDLNETQIYKMPYRDRYALFHEIEKNMSLKNLQLFTPNNYLHQLKTIIIGGQVIKISFFKLEIKNIFIWKIWLILKRVIE